ncbi:hypothetical protein BN946_scf184820.g4 [Trametes cinnabarina]|uniref:Uncharacterized protein n=1 Tax=Pycnoporus cinnabarinus TaxID=5643 RepID=A0A060SUU0_PYCCI|nr:hypothetical protein BN946_scf184820.g4 [Trametes cinnabarina]
MESYSSPIATSPYDFLEGPSSPRHAPSLDDYAFSFSYYLDREGAVAEPQISGNEVSTSQPDDYVSTSNAFGFVIQSLDYPPLPLDSPATRVAPPATPLSYEIPPNKGPVAIVTPPFLSIFRRLLFPSLPARRITVVSGRGFLFFCLLLLRFLFHILRTLILLILHARCISFRVFLDGKPRAITSPSVVPPDVEGHAAPPTLQQPNLRRSVRQRASRSVKRGNEERGPAPAEKGKTVKRSFAAPTQPIASGSAMPQAGPSRTKEVPERVPKRSIEEVDTTEHYGQNSLRYAKVNCLWPECDVQVPGNTLIDHVQEKHVGSVYRCPLSDTPGYKCIWTTPKSGYTGQHMRGIHGMEWPPVKKEPGVEP